MKMPSQQKKRRKNKRSKKVAHVAPTETRAAEALTVAWTVSLTTVLLCNLIAVAAHLYVSAHPDATRMAMLCDLILFAGALIGAVFIGLLPVIYRVRKVPPPHGLVVFGVLVAVGPIIALVVRMVR